VIAVDLTEARLPCYSASAIKYEQLTTLQDGETTTTRHRASTSTYSLTFHVRVMLP